MNKLYYNDIGTSINMSMDLSAMSNRNKVSLLQRLLHEMRLPEVLAARGHLEAMQVMDERIAEFWED